MDRRRRPPDEQAKRLVIGAFRRAIGESLRVHRAERWPTAGLDNRDHDLGRARNVENDAADIATAGGDLYELPYR
jgi:hypothetical protein